jgi:hypothetical protein
VGGTTSPDLRATHLVAKPPARKLLAIPLVPIIKEDLYIFKPRNLLDLLEELSAVIRSLVNVVAH